MKAYILIRARPAKAGSISIAIRKVPGITAADTVTGDYDAIAVCDVADVKALGELVLHGIHRVEGVEKTATCIVID